MFGQTCCHGGKKKGHVRSLLKRPTLGAFFSLCSIHLSPGASRFRLAINQGHFQGQPITKLTANDQGAVVIPDSPAAELLKKRLCIVAHMAAAGHRGFQATYQALREVFVWTSMTSRLLSIPVCIAPCPLRASAFPD